MLKSPFSKRTIAWVFLLRRADRLLGIPTLELFLNFARAADLSLEAVSGICLRGAMLCG